MSSEPDNHTTSLTLNWQQQGDLFVTKPDMTGLSYLEGLARGEIVMPPVAQVMGIRVVSARRGAVQFTMTVMEPFFNHLGFLAGGVLATGLDSALGCAVLSVLDADMDIVTLDLNVDFLRAVDPRVKLLVIDAEVSHHGRARGLATGRVTDENGRVYAIGKGNCLIRPKIPRN